jgi:hypothetical protein
LHSYPTFKQAENRIRCYKNNSQNNQYKLTHILKKPKKDIENKNPQGKKEYNNKKCAIFTYVGREVKTITKLFRNTNINIAYKTHNKIERILLPKLATTTDGYNNSGIYQLNCLEYPKTNIGQTGRTFKTRYKEHVHTIRTNRPDTG